MFPSELLKKTQDIFGDYLLSSFIDANDKFYFPITLTQADITPVCETGERYSKDIETHKYTAKCVKNF